jgi:hypothetical protein
MDQICKTTQIPDCFRVIETVESIDARSGDRQFGSAAAIDRFVVAKAPVTK